ncbi:patatin-like phospholipase family protein [Candidatus Thiodictyon syntrophicum]|uniref:patatin-like phospholipase family protein n=1 Tax=Candidatus Thiodictyon syntrophicum TaxID=1166950 RepID=UPI001F0311A2|nr:patatin-like phospholipase family protein [Candidatus Thiodictyon syntrophicum]
MSGSRMPSLWLLVSLLLLGGCATRPINPPITQTDSSAGYRWETRQPRDRNKENLVILAFSGGGTRAAAFSYGVLESLRRTEVVGPQGNKVRLLDAVDAITGVSGGSFTALAYGLYGDRLFDDYEQRFLKRDVQGEIVARTLSPSNWARLGSTAWGRSELAAELYDEVLFNGATFGDLDRGQGPLIVASATDISTGSRFVFSQRVFDVLCSDLNAVRLSRAAAASSAVPVVLSPVTINNYGGTCQSTTPEWVKPFLVSDHPPRPAARAIRALQAEQRFRDLIALTGLHPRPCRSRVRMPIKSPRASSQATEISLMTTARGGRGGSAGRSAYCLATRLNSAGARPASPGRRPARDS